MIKKYYFINKFETNNIDKQDKQTAIIYRNYSSELINEDLIIKIKKYCKKKGIKFYLSNNIKLALKLNLNGAYIPSFNKSYKHLAFSFKKDFKIIGSAHNLKEIRNKEIQKVEKIFEKHGISNENFLTILDDQTIQSEIEKIISKFQSKSIFIQVTMSFLDDFDPGQDVLKDLKASAC